MKVSKLVQKSLGKRSEVYLGCNVLQYFKVKLAKLSCQVNFLHMMQKAKQKMYRLATSIIALILHFPKNWFHLLENWVGGFLGRSVSAIMKKGVAVIN